MQTTQALFFHKPFFLNAIRLAIGLLIGSMAFFVWLKKRPAAEAIPTLQTAAEVAEKTGSPQPAAASPSVAADTVFLTKKNLNSTDNQVVVEVSKSLDSIIARNASREFAPSLDEKYAALAPTFYEFPKFNFDNRPDDDPVLEAEKMLWRKRFLECDTLLRQVAATSADLAATQRIRAHLFFQQGKIQQARQIFEKLKTDRALPAAADETDWYLLLCRLAAAGRDRQPFEQLAAQILKKTETPFAEKTRVLLDKITLLRQEGKL